MADFHEEGPLQIALHDVALDSLNVPFLSQWTYGAEWSKARILVENDSGTDTVAPDDDSEELKFEVHYRAWFGIAYFGLGRKHFAEEPLGIFLDQLRSTVIERMSAARAVELVIGGKFDRCFFHECVFGVANAWLENPRHTVPSTTPFTLGSLRTHVATVKDIFATGTDNPIMCEIIDTDHDVWLAFQISRVIDGRHVVDEAQADRILTEILRLS